MRITSLLALTSCLTLAACGTSMTKAPELNGPVIASISARTPASMDLPIGSTILGDSPIVVRKVSSGTGLAVLLGPIGVLAANAALSSEASSAGSGVAISKQQMLASLKKELDAAAKPTGTTWSVTTDPESAAASTIKINTFMAIAVQADNKMRSSVVLRIDDASKGAANLWQGQYTYHDPVIIDDSNKQKELGEGLKARMQHGIHHTVTAYLRDLRGELGRTPVEQSVFIDGKEAFGSVQPITLLENGSDGTSIFRAKCFSPAPLCYGVHILEKASYSDFKATN